MITKNKQFPNAPNPAETQVGLRFRLPDDATTTVEVSDVLQRIVLAPLSGIMLQRGEHELVLSVSSFPSGVYSVRVRATLANGTIIVEKRSLIIAR